VDAQEPPIELSAVEELTRYTGAIRRALGRSGCRASIE